MASWTYGLLEQSPIQPTQNQIKMMNENNMDRSLEPEVKVAGRLASKDLIPICAFGCPINQCNTGDICSMYLVFPDCCGCYSQQTCCCCNQEVMCCKPSNIEGECCLIDDTRCTIIYPTSLLSVTQQVCCIDHRCAMPPSDDVPLMWNLFGLTCCFSCGIENAGACCQTIGVMLQKVKDVRVDPSSSPSVDDRSGIMNVEVNNYDKQYPTATMVTQEPGKGKKDNSLCVYLSISPSHHLIFAISRLWFT